MLYEVITLGKQVLKLSTIVERTLHIGHKFVGNVNRESPSLHPDIEDMAGMLFTLQASFAVLANTSGTTKAERSQSGWPKAGSLFVEPVGDICRKFLFSWHEVYVPHSTYIVKNNLSTSYNFV